MDKEQIVKKLYNAYRMLLKNDRHLFVVNANERSITHKYAEYLQEEFTQWHVDCEYNRNGLNSKKLLYFKKTISSDDVDALSVYPDIIIHRRGTNVNLIVIEAKKSNNYASDEDKLKAYKEDLKYKYAFAVKFLVGEDLKNYNESDLLKLIVLK